KAQNSYYRRSLRLSENRGRLRQALYLLYYPLLARAIPQRSHGGPGPGSGGTGRTGGEGADSGSPGNYSLWRGFVWKEIPAPASGAFVWDSGNLLDTDSILLPGGDYR